MFSYQYENLIPLQPQCQSHVCYAIHIKAWLLL